MSEREKERERASAGEDHCKTWAGAVSKREGRLRRVAVRVAVRVFEPLGAHLELEAAPQGQTKVAASLASAMNFSSTLTFKWWSKVVYLPI